MRNRFRAYMIPYLTQKSKGCFGKNSLFYSESKPASLWGHLRPSFFSFAIPSFDEYRCRISPVFRPFLPKNRCVCETVCEDALLRPSAPMTHPGRSPAPTAPDFFAAVSPGGGCDPPSPHQDMVSITFSNRIRFVRRSSSHNEKRRRACLHLCVVFGLRCLLRSLQMKFFMTQ